MKRTNKNTDKLLSSTIAMLRKRGSRCGTGAEMQQIRSTRK